MTKAQLQTLLFIIDAVTHFNICTECAREIDFREFNHMPGKRGEGNYQHMKCPPRKVFYT